MDPRSAGELGVGKFCEGADRLDRILGEAAGVAVSCLTHGVRLPKSRSFGAIRSEKAAAEIKQTESAAGRLGRDWGGEAAGECDDVEIDSGYGAIFL